jgi:hypothetical protein
VKDTGVAQQKQSRKQKADHNAIRIVDIRNWCCSKEKAKREKTQKDIVHMKMMHPL